MESDLQQLIEQARSGESEAFWELVFALQAPGRTAVADLVALARSPEAVLRRAAVLGAQGRTEPELIDALAALADDPSESVRAALADALKDNPRWPLDRVVERLLYDEERDVRKRAVEAARWRPALHGTLVIRLGEDEYWLVRQNIAYALASAASRHVLPALVARLAEDPDADVQRACASSIEKHLAALGGYPADLSRPQPTLLQEAQRRVAGFQAGQYPLLAAWLEERLSRDVDIEQLATFGTLLTPEAEAGRLPRAYHVEEACEAIRAVLAGDAPRAAVLLGEPGTGKTAVVYELAHRLLRDPSGPWHILRVGPADFLTGTVYLGEWETKVRNLVQAIRHPRRVILYVPNLQELSGVGPHSKSDLNVATMLAPYIERGDITILGESTPDAFRTGLGAVASLRRLFHAVELRPADAPQTRSILQKVRDEAAADVSDAVLDRLTELADYYLTGTEQPGRAVGLLRRVLGARTPGAGPVTERDILQTLSTSTGIPVNFLDDSVPLDRAQVRAFFEARVMGQPEAVDTVVDLVTLVKAGLTDPGKPFGVLLFIGPTGVGKTELARALAELLFGDPGRMVRLDMSEFATPDSYERLIGWPTKPGLLTSAVRERPFAVLLFDEIEKANYNVFDLCLQIFDAGRLTDAQGRTADFRRTIIILTSNVGSRIAQEAPVGFGRAAPPAPDRDAVMRELGRWFRPEFLNRIDRIVHFRALGAETAEKIARREVARVLERSGIARRRLVIDVDPGVYPLLLREGYSPAFGARPLKRTVERLVLLPVAQRIAAGHVPSGSVLRLVARSNRVDVEVVPPEPPEEAEGPAAPARPIPLAERADRLVGRAAELRDRAAPLAQRRSELLAVSAQPGFWDNRDTARAVYEEVYRLDGVLASLDSLEKAARDLAESVRQHRGPERDLARFEERLDSLESQAEHVAFLVSCRQVSDLGDALVTLTLVASQGAGLNAVGRLARMYMGLCRRRGLEVEVLADCPGAGPCEDAVALQVSGAGAYALLAAEAGLHQVGRGRSEKEGGRRKIVDRDVVRVEVFRLPAGDAGFSRDEVHVEVHPLGEAAGRLLAKPKYEVHLLHMPSMIAVRSWTDGPKAEAAQRLRPLLRARVEAARAALANEGGQPPVVRRYTLGPAPRVRDLRSGRTTGRIDHVFEGHLDVFLAPPGPGVRRTNDEARMTKE
ncbi:MAG TPA: AAA family ATPase [Gemmataceae bacterium]|nr:AAA family ATPase [Gemmataceae bacterium]